MSNKTNRQSARTRPVFHAPNKCPVCGKPAIKGGTHCGLHGGRHLINRGMYHAVLGKTLGGVFQECADNNRGVDLTEELVLIRMFVARALKYLGIVVDKAAKGENVMNSELMLSQHVSDLVSQVTSVSEAIQRRNERISISPEQVQFVIQQMMAILGDELSPEALSRVAERMQAIPWPDLNLYDPTVTSLQKRDVGERLEQIAAMSEANAAAQNNS